MTMPVDSSDANGTVFVGNLDPLVKEEILYELFLQAGPVRRVTIARDREGRQRTFGFVLYKHAEAVPYAIALLNGISLYGRPLKLDFSNESTHDTGSLGSPGTEDRGPNAGRRVVCPQTSTLNGFNLHGDSRSQDQTPGRNLLGNCCPSPLPPLAPLSHHQVSPLTPLTPQQHPLHKLPPHPFFSPFSSTPGPIQPWPLAFWASPLTPLLPMMTPLLREQEQERGGEAGATPKLAEKDKDKEREKEKVKEKEKSLVSAKGKTRDGEKTPPPHQVPGKPRERERPKTPVKRRLQRERERPEVMPRKWKERVSHPVTSLPPSLRTPAKEQEEQGHRRKRRRRRKHLNRQTT